MENFTYQRRYRGGLKAVVFDWAGTLCDYGSCAPASVFMELFRKEGVDVTIAEAREPMGTGKRDHIQAITRMPRVAELFRMRFQRDWSEQDIDRMYEAFLPLQLATLRERSDLVPGVTEVVQSCRQSGLKIGTTTGYPREMVETLINESAKRGLQVDCVICGSDVPAGRPAPWMYFAAAQRLNVFPMEACVKVDDTVAGLVAGLNAGMWTVGVVKSGNEFGMTEAEVAALPTSEYDHLYNRGHQRLQASGAHYVIESVADLLPVLQDVTRRLADGEKP